jgi:hypothetical protein
MSSLLIGDIIVYIVCSEFNHFVSVLVLTGSYLCPTVRNLAPTTDGLI